MIIYEIEKVDYEKGTTDIKVGWASYYYYESQLEKAIKDATDLFSSPNFSCDGVLVNKREYLGDEKISINQFNEIENDDIETEYIECIFEIRTQENLN